jgi:hypothetical protein
VSQQIASIPPSVSALHIVTSGTHRPLCSLISLPIQSVWPLACQCQSAKDGSITTAIRPSPSTIDGIFTLFLPFLHWSNYELHPWITILALALPRACWRRHALILPHSASTHVFHNKVSFHPLPCRPIFGNHCVKAQAVVHGGPHHRSIKGRRSRDTHFANIFWV